jgi:chromosome segregation ATPase
MDDKLLLTLAGSLIGLLLAVIAYFIKREMAAMDKAKEKKAEEEKSLGETLQEISASIAIMKAKVENFSEITSEIEGIRNKLEIMEKEGNGTRHEIELLSQMIKPLFELKQDIGRAQQDIGTLFTKMDSLKEFLHRLEKDVILLKEKE